LADNPIKKLLIQDTIIIPIAAIILYNSSLLNIVIKKEKKTLIADEINNGSNTCAKYDLRDIVFTLLFA
jgi:hypothetical protein